MTPGTFHDRAVVVSVECRPLRRRLRPLTWMVLEEVALDAVVECGRLVARTSARQVAELLSVDPGTAAAALRVLRQEGLLVLEREKGPVGRFGLSVYVLSTVAGLNVLAPGGEAPIMAPASLETTDVATSVVASPRMDVRYTEQTYWAMPRTAVSHMASARDLSRRMPPDAPERADRLATPHAVGLARPARPRPADAGVGRRPRVSAARVASPEGWQVSVRACAWLGVVGGASWGRVVRCWERLVVGRWWRRVRWWRGLVAGAGGGALVGGQIGAGPFGGGVGGSNESGGRDGGVVLEGWLGNGIGGGGDWWWELMMTGLVRC